jgi:hypothetical protein
VGSLGDLHLQQMNLDAAAAWYVDGLARARSVHDRFSAGRLLAGLGKLHWLQHRLDEAEEALDEGEALLRECGDLIELLRLLCTRGHVELARDRRDAARSILAAAADGATSMGAAPDSVVAQEIEALRRALA